MNIINLTGKKFGRLFVLEKGSDYVSPKKQHSTMWICKCECGKIVSVSYANLNSGNSKSCGCLRRELNIVNLKGKTFGNLYVNKLSEKITTHRDAFWECICTCGSVFICRTNSLTSGNTKSCGCLSESFLAKKVKEYCFRNLNAKIEYKIFKNPETNRYLSFDIYIPETKIFIEINGEQHYRFVPYFHKIIENFEYDKRLDRMKRKFAKQNGIYIEIDLRKVKTEGEIIKKIEKEIYKCKHHIK